MRWTGSSTASIISLIRCGIWRSSFTSRLVTSGPSVPCRPASLSANSCIATTCATKVLVAATPISSPARVKITPSASRVAWLPMMLVIASTLAPRSRARRMAASVSAVSPDWEMPITRSCSSISGLR